MLACKMSATRDGGILPSICHRFAIDVIDIDILKNMNWGNWKSLRSFNFQHRVSSS